MPEYSFVQKDRAQYRLERAREDLDENAIHFITSEIVNKVLDLLKKDVYKIILYGSYARGDFNGESDIDILILLDCDKEKVRSYRKQISRLASRVALENDIEISLLLRDRETFEQGRKILPFYKNVSREGVSLYG